MFNCFLTALDSTLSTNAEEYLVAAIKCKSKIHSKCFIVHMTKNQVVYHLHFCTLRCEEQL